MMSTPGPQKNRMVVAQRPSIAARRQRADLRNFTRAWSKRVDELGFYNLGHNDLAGKVGLTSARTSAAVWKLKLQDDPDCFKEIKIGRSVFNRYSQHAIDRILTELKTTSADEMWAEYRQR